MGDFTMGWTPCILENGLLHHAKICVKLLFPFVFLKVKREVLKEYLYCVRLWQLAINNTPPVISANGVLNLAMYLVS